jgi:hypothetical protein
LNYPEPIEGLPIVAIDFDGVLAENIWPDPAIGRPIKSGIAMVLHYAEQGNEVLVYTARPESHKPRILKWLEMVGLHNDVYDVICGKIKAGLMVDDRCWNPTLHRDEALRERVDDPFGLKDAWRLIRAAGGRVVIRKDDLVDEPTEGWWVERTDNYDNTITYEACEPRGGDIDSTASMTPDAGSTPAPSTHPPPHSEKDCPGWPECKAAPSTFVGYVHDVPAYVDDVPGETIIEDDSWIKRMLGAVNG